MAKPELGTKRLCGNCGAKFYDLNKDPIVCPKCHTVMEVAAVSTRARPDPAAGRRLKVLTDDDRHNIATYPQVNALEYDHEIGHWFTPAQVKQMYVSNPIWASLEERVYGDLALRMVGHQA